MAGDSRPSEMQKAWTMMAVGSGFVIGLVIVFFALIRTRKEKTEDKTNTHYVSVVY